MEIKKEKPVEQTVEQKAQFWEMLRDFHAAEAQNWRELGRHDLAQEHEQAGYDNWQFAKKIREGKEQ